MLSNWHLALGHLSRFALLLDVDCAFGGEELQVCLAGEVGADATVGSIGTSSSLCSSVNLHVIDRQILEVLRVGVGLQVVD